MMPAKLKPRGLDSAALVRLMAKTNMGISGSHHVCNLVFEKVN